MSTVPSPGSEVASTQTASDAAIASEAAGATDTGDNGNANGNGNGAASPAAATEEKAKAGAYEFTPSKKAGDLVLVDGKERLLETDDIDREANAALERGSAAPTIMPKGNDAVGAKVITPDGQKSPDSASVATQGGCGRATPDVRPRTMPQEATGVGAQVAEIPDTYSLKRVGKIRNALKRYLQRTIKVSEFGLTNICVAKCSFCSIWQQTPKLIMNREDALAGIDRLADLGVIYVTLTGGEPLVHPDIVEIVERCTRRGMMTSVLCADGRLMTKKDRIKKLAEAGCDYMSISWDSHDPAVMEKSRGIKNLMDHIAEGVALCNEHGIKAIASILISKFCLDSLKPLMDKAFELGFHSIAVNYPENSLSPVYELGGDPVQLTNEQVCVALEELIQLKREGYKIMNPIASMKDVISLLRHGEDKVKFPCLGAHKVMFVDWHQDAYPCMHLPEPFGNLKDLDIKKSFVRKHCNQCNMSWYRDFSIYFHGMKSLPTLISDLIFNTKNM